LLVNERIDKIKQANQEQLQAILDEKNAELQRIKLSHSQREQRLVDEVKHLTAEIKRMEIQSSDMLTRLNMSKLLGREGRAPLSDS
jgi:adenylosuccinate synthase